MGLAEKDSSPISDRQSRTELDASVVAVKSDRKRCDSVRQATGKKKNREVERVADRPCSSSEEEKEERASGPAGKMDGPIGLMAARERRKRRKVSRLDWLCRSG